MHHVVKDVANTSSTPIKYPYYSVLLYSMPLRYSHNVRNGYFKYLLQYQSLLDKEVQEGKFES